MQIEQMPMARVFYRKTGRARHTSHLDVMRMFTRAFRRSGLPLWHTQGFNPHVYMMFALPLALGCESLCETLDIRLTREISFDEVTGRLNAVLPPGFEALRSAPPVLDPKEIAFADYEAELLYVTDAPDIKSFLARPVIEAVKKTKKGEKTIDIKPLCELLSSETRGLSQALTLRMAAGITLNINPGLLLGEFYKWANTSPKSVNIRRTRILTAENRDFE